MTHEMIFGNDLILESQFDDEETEEEAEEGEADIDDELLGELADDALPDDLLEGELDPLLKADESGFGELEEPGLEGEKEGHPFEDDDEDKEVDDYDSFDDRDEM